MSIQNPPEPPVQPDGPRNRKDAKADAKAAKAYAKAQRSWYQKKRYVLSLGAILLIVVISFASGGGGTDSASDTTATPAPAETQPETQPEENAAPPASGGPTAKMPIQNGDWRLDSIRVKDDGLGDFGGAARVTYTGDNPEGGINLFTVTVFVGDRDVAVLNGSANSVKPGSAATVQLISSDKFVGGPYKFDFQNDL